MEKIKFLWEIVRRKKAIELNSDEKMDSINTGVQSVFSQFIKMNDKLIEANAELKVIHETEIDNRKLADDRINRATQEYQANEKLRDKVQEFIV